MKWRRNKEQEKGDVLHTCSQFLSILQELSSSPPTVFSWWHSGTQIKSAWSLPLISLLIQSLPTLQPGKINELEFTFRISFPPQSSFFPRSLPFLTPPSLRLSPTLISPLPLLLPLFLYSLSAHFLHLFLSFLPRSLAPSLPLSLSLPSPHSFLSLPYLRGTLFFIIDWTQTTSSCWHTIILRSFLHEEIRTGERGMKKRER